MFYSFQKSKVHQFIHQFWGQIGSSPTRVGFDPTCGTRGTCRDRTCRWEGFDGLTPLRAVFSGGTSRLGGSFWSWGFHPSPLLHGVHEGELGSDSHDLEGEGTPPPPPKLGARKGLAQSFALEILILAGRWPARLSLALAGGAGGWLDWDGRLRVCGSAKERRSERECALQGYLLAHFRCDPRDHLWVEHLLVFLWVTLTLEGVLSETCPVRPVLSFCEKHNESRIQHPHTVGLHERKRRELGVKLQRKAFWRLLANYFVALDTGAFKLDVASRKSKTRQELNANSGSMGRPHSEMSSIHRLTALRESRRPYG